MAGAQLKEILIKKQPLSFLAADVAITFLVVLLTLDFIEGCFSHVDLQFHLQLIEDCFPQGHLQLSILQATAGI